MLRLTNKPYKDPANPFALLSDLLSLTLDTDPVSLI